MNKKALILQLLLATLLTTTIYGQLLNGTIDYAIEIHEVNYYNTSNEGNNDPEPAWEFTWSPNQPIISPCSFISDFVPKERPICITAPDETRHTIDIIAAREYDVPSSRRVYWKMKGWENDDFDNADYCDYDTGDDEFHCESDDIKVIDIHTSQSQGRQTELAEIGMGSSSWIPDVLWAYHNGNWNGEPLDFGNVENNQTYLHSNSNRSGHSDIGYSDQFKMEGAPVNASPEVVYSAWIIDQAKEVNLLVLDNVSDSYIHILKQADQGYEYIESIRGNKPSTTRVLCTGRYFFVIEPAGNNSNHEFLFQLSVQDDVLDPMRINPGEIKYPHDYYVINRPLPLPVSNTNEAAHPDEDISYSWQVTEHLNFPSGDFEEISLIYNPIPGLESHSFTQAYSGDLIINRVANAACWEASSNAVSITGYTQAQPIQPDSDCLPKILSNNNVDSTGILTGIYKSDVIIGQGQAQAGATVFLKVKDSLIFESGFTADTGSTLEISIENCND